MRRLFTVTVIPLLIGVAFGAGSDSQYWQMASDTYVSGMQTLYSTTVSGGQVVHLQSDGRLYPYVSTGVSYVYITVDGFQAGNTSNIDWYWGPSDPAQHSYEVIAAVNLSSGSHTVALVAYGTGSFYVGSGSNLSIMTQPATTVANSYLSSDTSTLEFDVPANHDGVSSFPSYGSTVLTASITNTSNAPIVVLASGRTYWGGTNCSTHCGDAMWNLEIDGNHEDNGSSSWSDNDISMGGELYAPMFTHGLFNYSSGGHTVGLDATAASWTSATDEVQYRIGASTNLIAYTGGMTVVGKSNPVTSSNTAGTNICIGSSIGWVGCPADGTPQLITSATVNIPSGHNGVVFFTGATRIQGNGPSGVTCSPPVCSPSHTNFVEGGGNVELYLVIDGVRVGSTGLQQLNAPDTVSARTLAVNYLATGLSALSVGNHTVKLYGVTSPFTGSAGFAHASMYQDMPLMWFD